MNTDDVIKRIIMLGVLLIVVPIASQIPLLSALAYLLLVGMIILLSLNQIEGFENLVSDALLERIFWFVTIISAILIFIIRIAFGF